jgi:hypothetical protein
MPGVHAAETPLQRVCWKAWAAQGFKGVRPPNWGPWCHDKQRFRNWYAAQRAKLVPGLATGERARTGELQAAALAAVAAGAHTGLAKQLVRKGSEYAADRAKLVPGLATGERARTGELQAAALAAVAAGAHNGLAKQLVRQGSEYAADIARLEAAQGGSFALSHNGKRIKCGQVLEAAQAFGAGGAASSSSLAKHKAHTESISRLEDMRGALFDRKLGGNVRKGELLAAAKAYGTAEPAAGKALAEHEDRLSTIAHLERARGAAFRRRKNSGGLFPGELLLAAAEGHEGGGHIVQKAVGLHDAREEDAIAYEEMHRALVNENGGFDRMLSPAELRDLLPSILANMPPLGREPKKVYKANKLSMDPRTLLELRKQCKYPGFAWEISVGHSLAEEVINRTGRVEVSAPCLRMLAAPRFSSLTQTPPALRRGTRRTSCCTSPTSRRTPSASSTRS